MNQTVDYLLSQIEFYSKVKFNNMNELLYLLIIVLSIYYLFGNIFTFIGLLFVIFWIHKYWNNRNEINKKYGISVPWDGKM